MRANRIVPMSRAEYASTGGLVYGTVFVDPAGSEPFAADMESRGLICPVKFIYPPKLMAAIAQVGREMGDSGAYLTIDGVVSDSEPHVEVQMPFPDHWWLPLNRIDDYQQLRGGHLVAENVLFSDSGQWGVAAILDGAALLGGRDRFAERVMNKLGARQDSQVESLRQSLLLEMSYAPPGYPQWLDIPLINDLFTHLFGNETAKQYLASWT